MAGEQAGSKLSMAGHMQGRKCLPLGPTQFLLGSLGKAQAGCIVLLSGQLSEAETTNLLELTNSRRTSATGIPTPCELGPQVGELRDRAAALKEERQ